MNKMAQSLEKTEIGFNGLAGCIEAVEAYNREDKQLVSKSLRAGEAIENIFAKKRWEEMGLSGFEALCKKLGWTRSNCYMLRNGWKMYAEFREQIPEGISVGGAYAWAELHKVHESRRQTTLKKAIALAQEDGEITGTLIQIADKANLGNKELKILYTIEDMSLRQDAENLAIEKAKNKGKVRVTTDDCHEAIRELSEGYSGRRKTTEEEQMVPADRKRTKQRKPTDKNYDELLKTTQQIFATNQELKEELAKMRSEMSIMRSKYEERIALMQEELERLRKNGVPEKKGTPLGELI
jgi:hypothetical protein